MTGLLKITDKGIIPVREVDKLVQSNDPILRKEMPHFDFKVRKDAIEIANRLIAVLQANKGLGLAAPQIGVEANVFVMGVGDDIVACFNPEIVHRGDEGNEKIKLEEGCLSFNQLFLSVERYKVVNVFYQDYNGVERTARFDGLTARVFQHELNHLKGILYIDHVGDTSLHMAKKKQKKLLGKK